MRIVCQIFLLLFLIGTLNACDKSSDYGADKKRTSADPLSVEASPDREPSDAPVWDFRGLGSVEDEPDDGRVTIVVSFGGDDDDRVVPVDDDCEPVDEQCNDLDDDCDGTVDEALVRACGEGEPLVCEPGEQRCRSGEWGACLNQVLGERERCNGLDDDCDGAVDEEAFLLTTLCAVQNGRGICKRGSLICEAGDEVCSPIEEPQEEACNGLDDDCDGRVDEEPAAICNCEDALWCVNPAGSVCEGGRCVVPFNAAVIPGGVGLGEPFELACEDNSPGRDDCNQDVLDGCETNLENDPLHCGACGVVCGEGYFCDEGSCVPRAVAMDAGQYSTCLVAEDGSVYCWGRNHEKTLGDPDFEDPSSVFPRLVPGIEAVIPQDGREPQIALGQEHACVLAWDENHEEGIACWGKFIQGQLGRIVIEPDPVFVDIEQVDLWNFSHDLMGKVQKIVAGEDHNCALYSSGLVICWGENNRGEVTGSSDDCEDALFTSCGLMPKRVRLAETAEDVACTDGRCCAVLSDRQIRCWGGGRAGIDDAGLDFELNMRAVVEGRGCRCGVSEDSSQVECINMRRFDDDDEDDWFPHSPEDGSLRFPGRGQILDIGLRHSYACAIYREDGVGAKPYCWGLDRAGETGNMPREGGLILPQPLQVWGISGNDEHDETTHVAVGFSHTCVLFESGRVQCFGDDQSGYVDPDTQRFVHYGLLGRGNRHPEPGYVPVTIIFSRP